jgi:hypothetical protein
MPKSKAKTKAGKQRAVAKEMGAFAQGTLKSGSGKKVTDRDQAIAISISQAGLSKPKAKRGKK